MNHLSFENFKSKSNEIIKFKSELYVKRVVNIILREIYKTETYQIINDSIFKDDLYVFLHKYLYQELKPSLSKIFLIKYKKYNLKNYKISIDNKELYLILKKIYKEKINFVNNKKNLSNFLKNIKYLINKKIILKNNKLNNNKLNNNKKYIGVSYIEGFDTKKKNDLYWFDKNNFRYDEIIVYFQDDYLKYRHDKKYKGEAEAYFKSLGIKTVDVRKFQKIYYVKEIVFLKYKLKKKERENRYGRFLNKILIDFFKKIEFWFSFFYEQNINVDITHLEIGTEIIAKKIAINLLNGCSVKKIRSYITDNDPRITGWYNENIIFVWGQDLCRRLNDTINKPNSIILSGYYDNHSKQTIIDDKLIKLTRKFKNNILILDNAWSNNKEKDIENGNLQLIYQKDYFNFYKSIFKNFENKNYGLIIKPKKFSLIQKCPHLADFLLNYENAGKCYVIKDAFQYPVDNLLNFTDNIISVGIYFPTVLVECILKKKNLNTYYYDYANLKNKEKKIYNNLLDKVFFNSIDKLLKKININLDENKNNYNIWENTISDINAFDDLQGNIRISSYIKSLRSNLEKHSMKDSIKIANDIYSQRWGIDKSLLLK